MQDKGLSNYFVKLHLGAKYEGRLTNIDQIINQT